MKVLVACEFSGVVREAFNAIHGVSAWSCDLLPPEDGRTDFHYQCDVREVLLYGWDMMIAHPDYTYLCSSGLHWNARGAIVDGRPRSELTNEALEFVRLLLDAPIPYIALENPIGCINTRIRQPDQYIQPYQFGHDASKKTGLWLKNLPLLEPTHYIKPRIVDGKKRWGNQCDSGQNKLGPSPNRWKERARTYSGWADAMADQWAPFVLNGEYL